MNKVNRFVFGENETRKWTLKERIVLYPLIVIIGVPVFLNLCWLYLLASITIFACLWWALIPLLSEYIWKRTKKNVR